MKTIEVTNLVKEYRVNSKKEGLAEAFKGIFKSNIKVVRAVDDISFSIEQGEIVGYMGPNGAGKSTTIKIMSGILTPTYGEVRINDMNPMKERKKVVKNLGVVFGQRTQLYWDLRLGESFELLKRIYRITDDVYKKNLDMMNDILKVYEIIDTPVRQLSLGQRMRGDLAAAFLHSPGIVFLDEPTIGLDVEAKHSIRKFIKDVNRERNTTIILTTHDLDDIQELCERIIIINNGKIVEDGSLNVLIDKIAPLRRLIVDFYDNIEQINHPKATVLKISDARICFEFMKSEISAAELMNDLSKKYKLRDITLEEAKIEDIIRKVYSNNLN